MKILALFFLLTACTYPKEQKINVGDCYMFDHEIYMIKEVGEFSVILLNEDGSTREGTFSVIKNFFGRVDCFDRFKKDKK